MGRVLEDVLIKREKRVQEIFWRKELKQYLEYEKGMDLCRKVEEEYHDLSRGRASWWGCHQWLYVSTIALPHMG